MTYGPGPTDYSVSHEAQTLRLSCRFASALLPELVRVVTVILSNFHGVIPSLSVCSRKASNWYVIKLFSVRFSYQVILAQTAAEKTQQDK